MRRWLARALLIPLVLVIFFSKSIFLWVDAWRHDRPVVEVIPPGFVDDASRLNRTRVAEVWSIPASQDVAESQLRNLLQRARSENLSVSIAGARHSMGGHTISPDGIVVDMLPFNEMEVDSDRMILRVGSGARWSQVIPFLNDRRLSVGVMQSNNNFSVGGSISVNCHGWQHNQPPIASTVESFRLIKADGEIVHCSPKKNPELFSAALGGFGLFGIILDIELRVVANERYQFESEIVPVDRFVALFVSKAIESADTGMAYGRLCVVPGETTFLRDAILTVFRRARCAPEEIPSLKLAGFNTLRREVYRAQIGSQSGKELRWKSERTLSKQLSGRYVSRNQLLNESVETYQEQNTDRTDILHEYFVPPEQFVPFLERLRVIVPKHKGELLNVTVRHVKEDNIAFLRYADREMFSFVMLFNQERNDKADRQMEAMTQELIDASLECAGRYYLPYRLHATQSQFENAYPRARALFALKCRYDPTGVFQNEFFLKYGSR